MWIIKGKIIVYIGKFDNFIVCVFYIYYYMYWLENLLNILMYWNEYYVIYVFFMRNFEVG